MYYLSFTFSLTSNTNNPDKQAAFFNDASAQDVKNAPQSPESQSLFGSVGSGLHLFHYVKAFTMLLGSY